MSAGDEWADRAKRFMKGELKRHDVTYDELARRLTEMGMPESKGSVASKLSRGGFTAAFFLASMRAVGCSAVRIDDL
jgi:hypothetical protein